MDEKDNTILETYMYVSRENIGQNLEIDLWDKNHCINATAKYEFLARNLKASASIFNYPENGHNIPPQSFQPAMQSAPLSASVV